jgi:hypothetical protein
VTRRPFVSHQPGTRFPAAPDTLDRRIRIALRMKDGAVLTARMVEELAKRLGIGEPPAAA